MSVFGEKITYMTKIILVYLFVISGPLVLVYNKKNDVCPHTQEPSEACQEFSKNLDYIGKVLIGLSLLVLLLVF